MRWFLTGEGTTGASWPAVAMQQEDPAIHAWAQLHPEVEALSYQRGRRGEVAITMTAAAPDESAARRLAGTLIPEVAALLPGTTIWGTGALPLNDGVEYHVDMPDAYFET